MGILDGLFRRPNYSSRESSRSWDAECKARTEKFGYAEVPASEVYTTFEQEVVPSCSEFAHVKRGLLARQVGPDIFQLLRIGAGKGGIYGFRWGVSLGYVPHEWDRSRKYHRTLKSVRFDLFEDPWEFLIQDLSSAEGWRYMVDALHGPVCFREDLVRAWANLSPLIASWFSTVQDLQGVLSRTTQHLHHNWRGGRHHPDPRLIFVFTLARLGKRVEAVAALGELVLADPAGYGAESLGAALNETEPVR